MPWAGGMNGSTEAHDGGFDDPDHADDRLAEHFGLGRSSLRIPVRGRTSTGLQPNSSVWQAATDDANPPSEGIHGHPWRMSGRGWPVASRSLEVVSGVNLWLRVDAGTALLIITKS